MNHTAPHSDLPPAEPLAVLGIGCRLPGGADSPSAYWRLLVEGHDAVTEIPADRWDVDALFDPEPLVPGRMSSSWGGFLRDPHAFDAAFFGATPGFDQRDRLLAQVAVEAMEHAGLPTTDAGLFVGGPSGAGRIADLLGLSGPSVAVDAGDSSALAALHLAAAGLRARDCDVALVGAATLILDPAESIALSNKGVLSGSGRCRAFEARSDGFVRSEGCGVVVLKRLTDALYDNDRVLAVIRSSAIGRSDLATVIGHALAAAEVRAEDVGFVEAHGSGVLAEDTAEFTALSKVYRCALGAVKSNLGHTGPVSGMAGLIKAVLAVRAGIIPPTPHFTTWHPSLSAEDTRLSVPTVPTDWPDSARLAAVSTMDEHGGNAHVLLEPAPPRTPAPRKPLPSRVVVPLSASTALALAETATRLADWLEDDGADSCLQDVAYTLARRRPRAVQAVVTASDIDQLVAALRAGPKSPGVDTVITHGELLDLPPTAWDRTVFPPPPAPEEPHPLLGTRVEVPATRRRVWQAEIGTAALPWLADHRIDDVPVLTSAAYFEMVLASASEHFACPPHAVEVRGVELHHRAELAHRTTISTQLTPVDEERAKIEIFGRAGSEWTRLATAAVRHHVEFRQEPPVEIDGVPIDPAELYATSRGHGIHHGPAFTAIVGLLGPGFARVRVPRAVRGVSTRFVVHPVLLDACLHMLGAGLLPVSAGLLRVHGDLRRAAYCRCELTELSGSVTVTDREGTVLLVVKDVQLSGRQKSPRGVQHPPLTRADVERDLIRHLRVVLGLPESTVIDSGTPLLELGVDEATAAQVRLRVERGLGLLVPDHPLWTNGSPGALSAYLANRFGIAGA
ncbi:beta-ketoacyl synthase N-terminal-like domain-containing protein [Allokutzneria albata]|uniref:Phosphopantetheine attachment site n=1 Tax=Allokutzneria albata TaxID=211114 RepID=A0A1G9S160_ALLAB|nr:beta-ketoacyl synthase N-terminal-like domain-containing protein [Allokutzneria albata]SDM29007.1 Phosphopantetheine attachment site [Allokutzneria albata]